MDKETTGLVMAATPTSRAAFGLRAFQTISYVRDGAQLSPLVRSRFEVPLFPSGVGSGPQPLHSDSYRRELRPVRTPFHSSHLA